MIHWLSDDTGYILHEHSANFAGAGSGWLSIKSFFGGEARYCVGRGRYAVADSSYLVLNHGQPYSVTIEAEQPVESFCLFFAPGFADAVRTSLTTPADRSLDAAPAIPALPLAFFERTYMHDGPLSEALLQLRRACTAHRPPTAWLVEQFHRVIVHLLHVHAGVRAEVDTLPATRAATREELYRRLYLAKEYADALFTTPITVNEMADVAGLSPNHFLRMFKHVFHQSPYQYVTSRRLAHAQHLLRSTAKPVTEICAVLGFESLSSFSGLFRRRVGLSPQAYRQQFR